MEPIIIEDVQHWRAWLDRNEDSHDGVWLVLAKKGVTSPTSLSYQEALEEALCSGWIDGQRKGRDEHTFLQRYTPRRARSIWSARNVGIIGELREAGRMRPRGEAEVDKAKADGRWDRAYGGPATAQVPEDLTQALGRAPIAREAFENLGRTERYSALHSILTAHTDATRARRIASLVAKLGSVAE